MRLLYCDNLTLNCFYFFLNCRLQCKFINVRIRICNSINYIFGTFLTAQYASIS